MTWNFRLVAAVLLACLQSAAWGKRELVSTTFTYRASACPILLHRAASRFEGNVLAKVRALSFEASSGYSSSVRQQVQDLAKLIGQEPVGNTYIGRIDGRMVLTHQKVSVSDMDDALGIHYTDRDVIYQQIEASRLDRAESELRQVGQQLVRHLHQPIINQTLDRILAADFVVTVTLRDLEPVVRVESQGLEPVELPAKLLTDSVVDFARNDGSLAGVEITPEGMLVFKEWVEGSIQKALQGAMPAWAFEGSSCQIVVKTSLEAPNSIELSGNQQRAQLSVSSLVFTVKVVVEMDDDDDDGGGGDDDLPGDPGTPSDGVVLEETMR